MKYIAKCLLSITTILGFTSILLSEQSHADLLDAFKHGPAQIYDLTKLRIIKIPYSYTINAYGGSISFSSEAGRLHSIPYDNSQRKCTGLIFQNTTQLILLCEILGTDKDAIIVADAVTGNENIIETARPRKSHRYPALAADFVYEGLSLLTLVYQKYASPSYVVTDIVESTGKANPLLTIEEEPFDFRYMDNGFLLTTQVGSSWPAAVGLHSIPISKWQQPWSYHCKQCLQPHYSNKSIFLSSDQHGELSTLVLDFKTGNTLGTLPDIILDSNPVPFKESQSEVIAIGHSKRQSESLLLTLYEDTDFSLGWQQAIPKMGPVESLRYEWVEGYTLNLWTHGLDSSLTKDFDCEIQFERNGYWVRPDCGVGTRLAQYWNQHWQGSVEKYVYGKDNINETLNFNIELGPDNVLRLHESGEDYELQVRNRFIYLDGLQVGEMSAGHIRVSMILPDGDCQKIYSIYAKNDLMNFTSKLNCAAHSSWMNRNGQLNAVK